MSTSKDSNKSSALNTDPVIIFPPKGKFNACDPDLIKEKIKIALQPKAKAAFFFGSFARDDGNFYSDIDLIIIKETSQNFTTRSFEFLDLLDIYPAMDILVYTPEEFENLTSNPSIGFWQKVCLEKQQLF